MDWRLDPIKFICSVYKNSLTEKIFTGYRYEDYFKIRVLCMIAVSNFEIYKYNNEKNMDLFFEAVFYEFNL